MFVLEVAFFVWIPCTGSTSIDFGKFFFKTGSHGTIHIFKNYFTTVFLVFSNNRYLNRPYVCVWLNLFEFGLELLENLDWVETFEVQLVIATEYIV